MLGVVLVNACMVPVDTSNTDGGSTDEAKVPTVSTVQVTNITGVSAAILYSIVDDNGSSIIESGTCYSNTSPGPSLADAHTSDGTSLGNQTSQIGGLVPRSTYYVRSYATNSIGTGYGSAIQFDTSTALTSGTYTESGNAGRVITILDDEITYAVTLGDGSPTEYYHYSYISTLTSNPSTNFTVSGLWYSYLINYNPFYGKYMVVKQQDVNTLLTKSSGSSFEEAYLYNTGATWNKN